MKKLVFILFALLLLIPISFADVEYSEAGESDSFFIRGNGVFNSQLDPADTFITTAIIANPKKIPLINDLDGDGVQEIIILNGRNINIFQNKSLDVAASLTLDVPTNERFSNVITFDIDGDSLIEIILVAEKNNSLHIVDYNASTFSSISIDLVPLTSHSSGVDAGLVTIGCESTNRCLMAYANQQDTGFAGSPDSTTLYASFFNSTNVANELALDTSVGFAAHCPPKIRTMSKADYDLDGDIEFIFTYSEPNVATGDSGDDIHILWVNVESDNTVTEEIEVFTTEVGEIIAPSSSSIDYKCDNENGNAAFRSAGGFGTALAEKFFTAPLVYDADPLTVGLETLIGAMVDNDEFIIIMYDRTGTELREFPLIQESEGQILSNVFRAEIFDDSTSEQDFCVFSQQSTDNQLSLTCGSLKDTDGFGLLNLQTIEFRGSGIANFNISDGFDEWNVITHSGEHDSSNSESEIITSFGTLEAELDRSVGGICFLTNNCDLNLIFTTPQVDGAVVPVDLDGVDLEDLIVLTSTNLFYIDDGFENQPATITEFTTNPCIDSVWKLNTSVQITVTATDPESDLVQVTATLYDTDSNIQSQESANVSSGTEVPFSFEANKTIGAGTLTMTGRDVENPDDIDEIQRSFSVAENGVEFNDCTTTETFVAGVPTAEAIEEVLNITASATANEGLVDFFEGSANQFNVSGLVIVLFLMLAWTIAVLTTAGASNNSMISMNKVLFMLVGNIFIFILGAIVGAIPFGVLLVVIILGIFSITLWARKLFTANEM